MFAENFQKMEIPSHCNGPFVCFTISLEKTLIDLDLPMCVCFTHVTLENCYTRYKGEGDIAEWHNIKHHAVPQITMNLIYTDNILKYIL